MTERHKLITAKCISRKKWQRYPKPSFTG